MKRHFLILGFLLACNPELSNDGEAPYDIDNPKQENVDPYKLQIWLDFEGGTLNKVHNCKTSEPDETCIDYTDGDYEAVDFDLNTQIKIGWHLKKIFHDFDIDIKYKKQKSGPVTHVIFSPMKEYEKQNPSERAGFTRTDCGNKNKNAVVFVVDDKTDSPERLANIAAHEIGHSLGFDHQSAVSHHVMFDKATPNTEFIDACIRVDDDSQCDDSDRAWRCNPGHRNYYRELLALLGPQKVWLSE